MLGNQESGAGGTCVRAGRFPEDEAGGSAFPLYLCSARGLKWKVLAPGRAAPLVWPIQNDAAADLSPQPCVWVHLPVQVD